MRRTVSYLCFACILIAAVVFGMKAANRSIPPTGVQVEGDAIVVYDSEIGFVPRPNSTSHRTYFGPDGKPLLAYHLYTDRLGARVSHPGEQTPDHVDLLFVGDSFTWGHGVENPETFAASTTSALGLTGANLAMGSYGTTQALQMLRRNRDLKPRLIIYSTNPVQPIRNIRPCAPSYDPFCLDYSYIAWDWSGRAYIAPPRSDGVKRMQLQRQSEKTGLDFLPGIMHDADVMMGRITAWAAQRTDPARQDPALEYLIGQMVRTANDMNASLLVTYIPMGSTPAPDILGRLASQFGFRFLDLSPAFAEAERLSSSPPLYIPNDGHPSAAGNALIARELVRFIQEKKILP